MIHNLTTKQLAQLLFNKLNEIGDNIMIFTPNTNSSFPCRVIRTPLESVTKTTNAVPLTKVFQVLVEHWNDEKYNTMEMTSKTDEKMQELNFVRIGTSPDTFDETTNKYILICTYEVKYNCITDSLEVIK